MENNNNNVPKMDAPKQEPVKQPKIEAPKSNTISPALKQMGLNSNDIEENDIGATNNVQKSSPTQNISSNNYKPRAKKSLSANIQNSLNAIDEASNSEWMADFRKKYGDNSVNTVLSHLKEALKNSGTESFKGANAYGDFEKLEKGIDGVSEDYINSKLGQYFLKKAFSNSRGKYTDSDEKRKSKRIFDELKTSDLAENIGRIYFPDAQNNWRTNYGNRQNRIKQNQNAKTFDTDYERKLKEKMGLTDVDFGDSNGSNQKNWSSTIDVAQEKEEPLNEVMGSVFPGKDWRYVLDNADNPRDISLGIQNFLETGDKTMLLKFLQDFKNRLDSYGVRF
jgi:hypothetical protein